MNWIDIIVLVAVGYGVFKGFLRGMILEATGLLGLIVGIWAGMILAFIFADYYRESFELPEKIVPALAFLTAFILGVIGMYFLGKFLNFAANRVALTLPNKLLGAAFGGLKFAFLIGTLLSVLGNSQVLPPSSTEGSATYPIVRDYCKAVNEYTVALIPAARNVFEDMETYFTGLDSVRLAQSDSLATDSLPDGPGN